MKAITADLLLSNVDYLQVRDVMRRGIIEHKKDRRIEVGPQVTFVFEDQKTTLFQIQEILRAEEITEPAAIAGELEVYNAILPGDGQLSATVMITFSEQGNIRAERKRLVGLMEGVQLRLGELRVPARFEDGRETDERISAVQYLHFDFDAPTIEALRSAERISLAIDHPAYEHETEIWAGMRASLLVDLAGE